MSKSSELDTKVKVYILECINTFDDNATNAEKIAYMAARFTSEYGHEIERYGRQKAMTNWLQGLALNIAFNNWEILELAQIWGSLPEQHNRTEKQEEKILDNYWNFMAGKTIQLIDGYRVPKDAQK